ncbi:hypothetical protein ACFU99_25875 [Streptomyces sp. NPDC057654]|uniref:hypothetical protein n=1 Tax=Streptomyces sp. NPDC057654 TaxID=3346196 RepID=UPI00369C379D
MAFSADELRVLRRALAIALQPHPVPAPIGPARAEEVQDCLRLAEAVDEAVREGGRLRAFLLADLARYRSSLPGSAPGYLRQLQDALTAGYLPRPDDLTALRSLCAAPAGDAESDRRRALLHRCERIAERSVRARLAERAAEPARPASAPAPAPVLPGSRRAQLLALPGGRGPQAADESEKSPEPRPASRPAPAKPGAPQQPKRPAPTPAEVFPPRRRPDPAAAPKTSPGPAPAPGEEARTA